MNIYSPKEMTDVLERHGFYFKKNLGQNFLMNEEIARKIALASLPDDGENSLAIEIGPGAGALTRQLSDLYQKVLAIEIDPFLKGVLDETLADRENIELHLGDALQFDYSALAEQYPGYSIFVCSNLPYYLTSEILMRLLESGLNLRSITVLIQKEAAARLVSKPGSPEYGAIAAVVSYYAKAEKLFSVGPGNFIPRPKIDSSVLRLTPYKQKPVAPRDPAFFLRLIHAAFSSRRKTLLNSLSNALAPEFTKEMILSALDNAGISPMRRGETLTLKEFSALSDELK